ncbi:class I SAM-dependent methyltransferase [Amycolatopsis sp. 195334CR]|uniref:class I SAM-dependent methyltransferase n=1 Tax=Amycolatopsis sp. 195334CR TaxID=2814588 RepID=UPI001A8F0A80|nr:class I SAM-dependent methyltransferase [Amycolatopsis sp. 195334CR]MBN6034302.1 class I SAM-dependent methyltransferase [Amycolatopsis sp. 195334CR]
MAMNWYHRKLCSSEKWAKHVEDQLLPWSLDGVDLGDNALEIGPGYGANLRVLVDQVPNLTALEIDGQLAGDLQRDHGTRAKVVHGDGTAMPLPDKEYSSVVCFTMLHHVPTAAQQDRLFAEAFRVLRPGGVFAGSDGIHGLLFRLIHLGDTYNPIPHDSFPRRLAAAGFEGIEVTKPDGRRQRWRAVKP